LLPLLFGVLAPAGVESPPTESFLMGSGGVLPFVSSMSCRRRSSASRSSSALKRACSRLKFELASLRTRNMALDGPPPPTDPEDIVAAALQLLLRGSAPERCC
jgi:hypothetical protein